MSVNSDNLATKPCKCGAVMGQIIGFEYRSSDDTHQPYRVGWYCSKCRAFDTAILRERVVLIV
jgi:hypothetical protein